MNIEHRRKKFLNFDGQCSRCFGSAPRGDPQRLRAPHSKLFAVLVLMLACAANAEIHKFNPNQPETRNLGVWKLTHDPAIRDYGNYHNKQCWSSNGRYTCYTRFAPDGPEIHVVDLSTGKDTVLGKGRWPRWAHHHNWLFYVGDRIIRFDADTGERHKISEPVSILGGVDHTDSWLYGTVEEGNRYTTMRTSTEPGSELRAIKPVPSQNGLVNPNPRHPMIMVRSGNNNRAFYALDGSNVRSAMDVELDGDAHTCWSGDGTFLLLGNRQVTGRYWNKPFPSDLEVLSVMGSGDISPFDKAGRYYCGTELVCSDTRSGDAWHVVLPRSHAVYPMDGDHSTATDIDPKGSPDGTKIHYHSNRDLEHFLVAKTTETLDKDTGVIAVESTEGFPASGDLVFRSEVIGYDRKTATAFEGIERKKYGTRPGKRWGSGGDFYPLSAFVLSEEDRARSRPDPAMLQSGVPPDYPLLYQRQTDCYVVVVRLPFPPHLRQQEEQVELIPGEHHWETRGFRVFRDGALVEDKLFRAGDEVELPGPGAYTAVAVEWSGLESPPSLPLTVDETGALRVLEEIPTDFSWTRKVWSADKTSMELHHIHDGRIAREEWRDGERVLRVDFNEAGLPIRRQKFQDGKLRKRTLTNRHNLLVSEEHFGDDGFKTEYIKYYASPDHHEGIDRHWWYKEGRPVKYIKTGKVVFDHAGE